MSPKWHPVYVLYSVQKPKAIVADQHQMLLPLKALVLWTKAPHRGESEMTWHYNKAQVIAAPWVRVSYAWQTEQLLLHPSLSPLLTGKTRRLEILAAL